MIHSEIYATVRQSALIHPEWNAATHLAYLRWDAFLEPLNDPKFVSAMGILQTDEEGIINVWLEQINRGSLLYA